MMDVGCDVSWCCGCAYEYNKAPKNPCRQCWYGDQRVVHKETTEGVIKEGGVHIMQIKKLNSMCSCGAVAIMLVGHDVQCAKSMSLCKDCARNLKDLLNHRLSKMELEDKSEEKGCSCE